MRRRPFMSLFGALLASASLCISCVDTPGGGTTGGTVLYAYDGASQQIYEWDAQVFFDSDNPPILKTLGSSLLTSKMGNLSWGGMVLDSSGNRLYLVNESTGDVVRINNIRGQVSGTISPTSPDVATFALGQSSDHLSNGKFGQAALDPGTGTLYVTEKSDSATQIWVVNNAGGQSDKTTVSKTTITVSNDKGCTGVAAGLGGQVFAYFDSGDAISIDQIFGPRLRKGTSTGFSASTSVLIGTNTALAKYGTLALDSGNNILFVARHNVDSAASGAPLLAFSIGKFNGGGYNQAPDFTLGNAGDQSNVRVLSHPGNKEWLAALTSSGETPTNQIQLWKLPRDPATVVKTKSIGATTLKGIAFDGNN